MMHPMVSIVWVPFSAISRRGVTPFLFLSFSPERATAGNAVLRMVAESAKIITAIQEGLVMPRSGTLFSLLLAV